KVFAEAHIDDARAVIDGIPDAQRDILIVFVAIGYATDHHDPYVVADAVHALAISPYRGDDPRDMRAMHRISGHDIVVAVIAVAEIVLIVLDDLVAVIPGRRFLDFRF